MDVEQIIEKVKEKLNDDTFKEELKKNPGKAIEDATGVNLPDEQIKAVIAAVKGKMTGEGAEGIVDNVKNKIESLFHKDK